mmetsp:Transcript_4798/g.12007  ORF Transcript_4798/g.12007 Transcript_4798/m.12007 type:complete len:248 (-) Transcript_4798:503-1246(-)
MGRGKKTRPSASLQLLAVGRGLHRGVVTQRAQHARLFQLPQARLLVQRAERVRPPAIIRRPAAARRRGASSLQQFAGPYDVHVLIRVVALLDAQHLEPVLQRIFRDRVNAAEVLHAIYLHVARGPPAQLCEGVIPVALRQAGLVAVPLLRASKPPARRVVQPANVALARDAAACTSRDGGRASDRVFDVEAHHCDALADVQQHKGAHVPGARRVWTTVASEAAADPGGEARVQPVHFLLGHLCQVFV